MYQISDIMYQILCSGYQVSDIKYHISSIIYQESYIKYKIYSIRYQVLYQFNLTRSFYFETFWLVTHLLTYLPVLEELSLLKIDDTGISVVLKLFTPKLFRIFRICYGFRQIWTGLCQNLNLNAISRQVIIQILHISIPPSNYMSIIGIVIQTPYPLQCLCNIWTFHIGTKISVQ